jgi:hypothetical protein
VFKVKGLRFDWYMNIMNYGVSHVPDNGQIAKLASAVVRWVCTRPAIEPPVIALWIDSIVERYRQSLYKSS